MAISEACQFEIRDEVNGMIEREEVGTKTDAFGCMVKFYASIGIEINQSTIRTKYYRAEGVSNETTEESEEITESCDESKEISKPKRRAGAGRKKSVKKRSHEEHWLEVATQLIGTVQYIRDHCVIDQPMGNKPLGMILNSMSYLNTVDQCYWSKES